jgi:hypothetical protein
MFKNESRRPRRNSESSVLDSQKDEDRRRRERRKEREERREKDKDGKLSKDSKGRPTRKPKGLDIIDKLDVTGIYGQGRE